MSICWILTWAQLLLLLSSRISPLQRVNETAAIVPAAIGKMQTVLAPTGTSVPAGRKAPQRRSQRAVRLACRAQGGLNPPTSLIGCHSQVWVGGWEKQDIIKSVEGTKNAGFDLIEGMAAVAIVKSRSAVSARSMYKLHEHTVHLKTDGTCTQCCREHNEDHRWR